MREQNSEVEEKDSCERGGKLEDMGQFKAFVQLWTSPSTAQANHELLQNYLDILWAKDKDIA